MPHQSLTVPDLAGCAAQFVARFDDVVVKPLMVSFGMIMGNEFLSGVTERPVTEENYSVKTVLFYGSNETFEMCGQIRRSGRQADAAGARLLDQSAKVLAVLGVSIHEQVALLAEESIQGSVRLRPTCIIQGPAGEAAGVGRVTWHQFRHIHSSTLHQLGVPVKIAQQQLGHASIETTFNIYTHVVDSEHRKAICALDRLLFPNVPKFDESRNSGETVN